MDYEYDVSYDEIIDLIYELAESIERLNPIFTRRAKKEWNEEHPGETV